MLDLVLLMYEDKKYDAKLKGVQKKHKTECEFRNYGEFKKYIRDYSF